MKNKLLKKNHLLYHIRVKINNVLLASEIVPQIIIMWDKIILI